MKPSSRSRISAARTERGKVRERNEDAFLDSTERGIWVVADGMGGHQYGDVASQLIIDSLADAALGLSLDNRLTAVRECLIRVNHQLGQRAAASASDPRPVIGSTVVALLIEGLRAACVWAGDSRCYLWRDRRLYQLSRDHSLRQALINDDQMCPHKAARHPAANALTRAVGGGATLHLDSVELDVWHGDVFVLCSDGLYEAVDPKMLGDALNIKSPRLSVDLLCDHVLRGAAVDNLTAVVVRV